MKIIIAVISVVVGLTLVSCGHSSADSTRALEKLYPKAEIYKVDFTEYIIIDSTGIYYLDDVGIGEPDFNKALIKKY